MRHRFLSPALAGLSEAAVFYDERVPGLDVKFLDEVAASVARVLQLPEAGSRMSEGFRRCALRRFPYILVYTILDKARS